MVRLMDLHSTEGECQRSALGNRSGLVPIPLVDISIAQDDLRFGIRGDQLWRKQSGRKVGDGLSAGLALHSKESSNRRYLAVPQQLIPLLSSKVFPILGLGVYGVEPQFIVLEVVHGIGHVVCFIEAQDLHCLTNGYWCCQRCYHRRSGHPQLVPVRPTPNTRHRMGTTRLHCRRSIFVVDCRSILPRECPYSWDSETMPTDTDAVKPWAWNRDRGTEVVGHPLSVPNRPRVID